MRSSLELKPLNNSFIQILMAFNNGKPLTSDQLNFLRRYHHMLNNPMIDSVCRYYGIINNKHNKVHLQKPRHALDFLDNLKEKVTAGIKHTRSHCLHLTLKQLLQFKVMLMNELIFLHGNHTLTGAPFFPGGVPHVEFFQWGNLFGIVKYEEILGETALDANILIYFEEKQDKTLAQFAKEHRFMQPGLYIVEPKIHLASTLVDDKHFQQSVAKIHKINFR